MNMEEAILVIWDNFIDCKIRTRDETIDLEKLDQIFYGAKITLDKLLLIL